MAVNMRGVEANVELAGNWAIDTIENLADDQPQKCGPYMTIDDGLEREEPCKSPTGRQNMNTEARPTLGLGTFTIGHTRSLRRMSRRLRVWTVASKQGSRAQEQLNRLLAHYNREFRQNHRRIVTMLSFASSVTDIT